VDAAQGYVPVRVLDMRGVDLSVFRFDFDLTFAVLLMNADGTIYHTFAGRDWTHADSHLAMAPLVALLRATRIEHAAYQKAPAPPKLAPRHTIEQFPDMAKRIQQGKAPACMHCHMVNDQRHAAAQAAKRYRVEDAFDWPDPVQVGWRPEREAQTRLAEVTAGSAAARAGMQAGDRLVQVGDTAVATFGDIARALHRTPERGSALKVRYARGEATAEATLRLPAGWQRPDPAVFAWRPSKWRIDPRPGFGGPRLSADDCAKLGLARDAFAFRVQYLVDWGDEAYTGRNAKAAGLRKGDVVLSVGGKSDFTGVDHFHAWFCLTRRAGERVPIEVLRNGKRERLVLPVVVE
jgi:hypothetical protein